MINNFEKVKSVLTQVQKRQRVRLLSPEKIENILSRMELYLKETGELVPGPFISL